MNRSTVRFLFFSLTLPFINVLFRNSFKFSKFFKYNYRISISFIPSYFCHKFHICKFTLMLYCIFLHPFFFIFFFKRRLEIKEIHEGKQFNFLKEKNVNKIFSQHPTHHFHCMTLRKKKNRETILIISHGKQFLLNVLSLLLSLLLSFVERNIFFFFFNISYSTQTFTAFPPSNKLFFLIHIYV